MTPINMVNDIIITSLDAVRRHEILARQPSYCKILNDLKEVESSEEEITGDSVQEKDGKQELIVKGEAIEVVEGTPAVIIN